MTFEEALMWYGVGLGAVFSVIAGPFLVVVVWRWARNLLS